MFEIAVAPGLLTRIEGVAGHLDGVARFREIEVETPEQLADGTQDADALVVTLHSLRSAHIAALGRRVRVVGRAGVGLDTIDLDAARTQGVAVVNQPDYATAEVATHAVAMMLAVHRRLLAADRVARGDWSTWSSVGKVVPIEEQSVGVIGGGRIGRAVIDRLRPFAQSILLHDPKIGAAPARTELVLDLYDLLARSDIVTLHLPLDAATHHLIGVDTLKAMPQGAILVNVSRGGLIDEAALVESIRDNHLAGAALDVMAVEPLVADSRLLGEPRILLSPHVGWYSESSSTRLWRMTADGIVQYLSGRPVTAGNLALDGSR
jgi:D-3-phosphoglycerate dehydrogenase